MAYSVPEKPVIRRTDKTEVRLWLKKGWVRFVPLDIQYGEIVPRAKGGLTLRRKDFAKSPETLEALIALLNTWRQAPVKVRPLNEPAQVKEMQDAAARRKHLWQQRIDAE